MITLHELANRVQVSTKTIQRWVHYGFLPEPAMEHIIGRRGRVAMFPDDATVQAQRIASFSQKGFSPEAISYVLAQERQRAQDANVKLDAVLDRLTRLETRLGLRDDTYDLF